MLTPSEGAFDTKKCNKKHCIQINYINHIVNTGYIDVLTNPHFRNFARSAGLASYYYLHIDEARGRAKDFLCSARQVAKALK